MVTTMKDWMRAADASEQERLAYLIGTTRKVLYQYSAKTRAPSAARGADIERCTRQMSEATQGRLPIVLRTELVEACARCEFAQRCLGGIDQGGAV